MPSVGSGGIFFSGLNKPIRCEMTSGYGTAPSAGTITFREQPQAPRIGDLTLDCDGNVRRWRDCRLNAFQKVTDGGQNGFVVAQLLDRRWKWQWATISGRYNVRRIRGGFQTGTEKTPRELATLLFKAMGETGADVSALPDSSRPEINWDVSSAADELARLCESLACRVVLGSDDRARIVRLNTGQSLQDSPYAFAMSQALNTPDPPDKVRLVGDRTRYQCRLLLEAVGEEVGGTVRPLENLSYKPPRGFLDPVLMGDVKSKDLRQNDGSLVNTQQLARNTVYRWYQVKKDKLEITDELKDVSRDHIEIIPELVEKYIDELGVERFRPAFCAGVWITETKPDAQNSKDDTPIVTYSRETSATQTIGFSVDPSRWLVQFSEPVWKRSSDGTGVEPAEIYLVCTVIVLDKDTRAPERFEKTITLRSPRGGSPVIETIRRDDIVKRVLVKYQTSGAIASTEVLDQSSLDARADYYLDAQRTVYENASQFEIRLKGIHDINVDGIIQQTTHAVSTDSGAETSASEGYEANRNIPGYDDWRQRQKRAAAELETAKK